MAGTLTIDQLKASTGVLATQNGMTGIAKAWVQLSGSTTSPTINGSFNISSITRIATGEYTFAFTIAMPNINYAGVATAGIDNIASNYLNSMMFGSVTSPFYVAPTTSGFRVYFCNSSGIPREPQYANIAVFSS